MGTNGEKEVHKVTNLSGGFFLFLFFFFWSERVLFDALFLPSFLFGADKEGKSNLKKKKKKKTDRKS